MMPDAKPIQGAFSRPPPWRRNRVRDPLLGLMFGIAIAFAGGCAALLGLASRTSHPTQTACVLTAEPVVKFQDRWPQ
jgi:hypothetical protein